MVIQHNIFGFISKKIQNDTLVIPTLPSIALKVRAEAERADVNLGTLAKVIALDPGLTARIIKIANSALLGGRTKLTSIEQALARIGLRNVKNVATALAMEQLFTSKNTVVQNMMKIKWDDIVDITANALSLFHLNEQEKNLSPLNIETLTLCSMVADIGALPILTEIERCGVQNPSMDFVESVVNEFSAPVGKAILEAWNFDKTITNVVSNWRNLSYNTLQTDYLDFVRAGASIAGITENSFDMLNTCIKRGVLKDLQILDSEQYAENVEEVKKIYI